ncbi:MAG: hypothetical protein KatS3mg045_1809 [Bellilinea sp.]|nr:MAG: hypothetical protein KatS3mg045_1809 [Bellilinea sp.]
MNTQNGQIEVNRATVDELASVPGIGPALAERIVAARPFASVEELTRVSGIGPASLEKIKPYLKVEYSAAPVEEEPFSTVVETQQPAADESTSMEDLVEDSTQPEGEMAPQEAVDVTQGETAQPAQAESEPLQSAGAQPTVTQPPVPQPAKGGEKWVRRDDLIWTAVGVAILTLILSLIFTLGTLALINQTLTYAPAAEAQALSNRLDALNNRIRLLEGDVDNLRSRVQTIEALGGRVTSLERGQQSLSEELKAAQGALDELQQQTTVLQNQIEELQKRSNVFQNFLDGLRRLLSVGETP